MELTTDKVFTNFEQSLQEFKDSGALTKKEKASKLASHIDILSLTRSGLAFLYGKSVELDRAEFFKGTSWNDPDKLVPYLVKGTLKYGHPSSSFETLSELRMLRYAKGEDVHEEVSAEDAQRFLEEVIVHNLEFALREPTEETRMRMPERELKKVFNLFGFIMSEMELKGVYEKLVEEVRLICEQRPIRTSKARELISLVNRRFDTSGDSKTDTAIRVYINALYAPSKGAKTHEGKEAYQAFLENTDQETLAEEAAEMGEYMNATGLVSGYQAIFLKYIVKAQPDLVPTCLDLNDRGSAEWDKYHELVTPLILETVSWDNCQCIYGLARMLRKNLFSRRAVRVGLENLRKIKINPQVEKRILKSLANRDEEVTALQYLIGGSIKVLGQPLGVGQGNNPTCQSARGISMWSQHSPAKLIDMIITVATQNNLIMRFENQNLVSNNLIKGLVDQLDYNLDVVSVVLVPHLDKIYNEMMRLSAGRLDDPHKWVNPAMYGQWIQVGFASCYDYLSNSIMDFPGFTRIFYAAFHPDYNGNQHMVYPNPVGIFITSNKGDMIGFHAVSLLRVDRSPDGEVRAYFLNPNNEGRQDWGQDILPSVYGKGEKKGESSLPFHQFAARIYAYHYSTLDVKGRLNQVPAEEIERVEKLGRESWGKSYTWNQQTKLW
ncbi:hypothetical protein PBT90_02300 [Algoriphagus halophytocola]|uniref:Uncharacterized protein n=1 Tax=Algoriphagus halophytocola TaxID=2991499 RepID=A0ABY6MER7_9BACT|nr:MULTISPECIES: hypothetical protein [unclassified Algoriphagus]UZD22277.1 hypothetical protein OM944_16645 [Algoriphagus sp. TR-M5]WBL43524.1 hypothetical protein PBT90_02300 [Algoriphagus sp. TR-M9]